MKFRPISKKAIAFLLLAPIAGAWLVYNIKYSMDLDARVKSWENEMAEQIPVGSTKEKIQQWGRERHLRFFTYVETNHSFSANVETMKGIGLICPDWNIIVHVDIGRDDRSRSQKVSTVGSCI